MSILGANWRTTVSGIGSAVFGLLGMVAALPYQLGDIATIIPPLWKAKVVTASLLAGFALRIWNAMVQKDKQVTGGSIQQDTSGAPVPEDKAQLVEATKAATV